MAKVATNKVSKVVSLGNPLGVTAIIAMITLVAKVLKSLGVLDQLAEMAEETDSSVDNSMIQIAKAVLEILAK